MSEKHLSAVYLHDCPKSSLSIRTVDFCLALPLCIASLPFIAFISILIKLFDKGPIFFTQKRLGREMEEITIIKFRTMSPDAANYEAQKISLLEEPNLQSEHDERITKFGKILRLLSLDELPQLFLVLMGKMSLVGPRPLIRMEVEQFPEKYLKRFQVLPGITGLGQISGRSSNSVWDLLEYDIKWVEEYSLGLYLKILVKTPLAVCKIKNVC